MRKQKKPIESQVPLRGFLGRYKRHVPEAIIATRHPRTAVLVAWLRNPSAWAVLGLAFVVAVGLFMLLIGTIKFSMENHGDAIRIGASIVGLAAIGLWVKFHHRSFMFALALALSLGAYFLVKTQPGVEDSVQTAVKSIVEYTNGTSRN